MAVCAGNCKRMYTWKNISRNLWSDYPEGKKWKKCKTCDIGVYKDEGVFCMCCGERFTSRPKNNKNKEFKRY